MIIHFMSELTNPPMKPNRLAPSMRSALFGMVIGLIVGLGFVPPTFCVPDDLTLASFEKFKQSVAKEVEEELAEEFKLKEEKINKLSKPFQVGDFVSITLIQGGRKRVVNGTFKGIKGQNAEIGDRQVLLSDIEELDRDRLFFGGEIQLLQLKVNQKRKALEEDKDRRREILLAQKYKKAGYTKKFFANSVQLAGRFWPLSDLGDKKARLRVELEPDGEFVRGAMKYKLDMETSCVISLDKMPIYFSELSGDEYQGENTGFSGTISFRMLRSDLGESLLANLKERLSVWIVYKDSGFWSLRPEVDRRSHSRSTKTKVEYTLRLVKSSIKKPSRQVEQQVSKMISSAKAYQEGVQKHIDMLEDQARQEEEKRLREAEEKAAELAKEQEMKRLREQRIKGIEQLYSWLTPKSAKTTSKSQKNVITLNEFDDMHQPSSIDNQKVEKFTRWIDIPTDSRILFGTKYRILKVNDDEHGAKFLLHYLASYVNSQMRVIDFTPTITIMFSGGEQEKWSDTYHLPASWAGDFHGAHELPLDKMEHVIEAVVIEQPGS